MTIYTVGAYGSTEAEFFDKLRKHEIDVFCDIRARRGVRGAEYAFANAARLEARLRDLNIAYRAVKELATPEEIRQLQAKADAAMNVGQRQREQLSSGFVEAYQSDVLDGFDLATFVQQLEDSGAERVALFCVEKSPAACHRSLVADRIHKQFGLPVIHL
ncbi:MAG: DUF488 domain-containing protein [Armatimonadetes bacterium]|nr:DUF488 domain-containing protein [Armatimonadota bacterium]